MKTVKQLQEERETKLKAARAVAEKADEENREFTDDEKIEIKGYIDEAAALKKEISSRKSDSDLRDQIKSLTDEIEPIGEDAPVPGTPKANVAAGLRTESFGKDFIESDEFKNYMKQFTGGVPKGVSVQTPPVNFKSLLGRRGLKAPLTGADDASAGAFVQTDYSGILELLGRRELTLRDLISIRQTESDTIEFVRQLTRVNAAAPVPEAETSAAVGSGDPAVTEAEAGVKPEGGFTFQKVTTPVKTIAEWVPATKRAMSDAKQLMGIIDDELMEDLAQEEEDQILNGDGTGENLAGIMNTSGTQSQAWDTDLFVTTRKAVTKVQTVGRSQLTAFLVNPLDDERFDLARDAEGRFHGAGPFAVGPKTLWGRPRVVSEAMPEGFALGGDFRKAVLWDREEASIQISDSHADFFIRNLIAVLAEERVAFGVIRPSAFCEIDLTA